MFGNKRTPDPKGYSYRVFSTSDVPVAGTGMLTAVRNVIPFYVILVNAPLQAKAYRVRLNKEITDCNLYMDQHINLTIANLQALFNQLSKPFAVFGDFNARSPLWGATTVDVRGQGTIVEDFILQYQPCIINNGQQTHFHTHTSTESAIDLSIVSPELVPELTWEVADYSKGSNYFPNKITSKAENTVFRQPKYILKKAD